MFDNVMSLLKKKYFKFSPLYQCRRSKFFVKFVLPVIDFQIPIKIHRVRHKVWINPARNLSWLLNSRILSPQQKALFLAINEVFQPKLFWDIGANIGFYSWLLMSYNSNMQVVMFEPDPENIILLNKTISQAEVRNIKLVSSAVSDRRGKANFATDKITGATGTLEVSKETFIESQYGATPDLITVDTLTLDEYYAENDSLPPDLIKIDVEGADKKVFDGARQLIKETQPIIIFECSSITKNQLLSRLEELGYQNFNADNISGNLKNAYNVLALPARYCHLLDTLFKTWHSEIENYISD